MPLPDFVAGQVHQALELGLLAAGFFILALLVKGVRAVSDGRAALAETKRNLSFYVLDALTISPAIALASASFYSFLHQPGVTYAGEALWAQAPPVVTGVAAVFICDFLGYCNHRLYHTRWLWPSHVIHHSDTRLTWFSLVRQHPLDRFGAIFDVVGMILLGLPDWAIVTAVLVRHYWGHLIHADLPWTLGHFGLIFVSPAMHRWHHALEQRGAGVNFATVFSVFDRLFGTFYAPGACTGPTGVDDVIAPSLGGQYLHPFRVWLTPRTARLTPPAI